MNRPWPEAELASALAVQNSSGKKRVLPLILNSRKRVLNQYPLLTSLAYREYCEPAERIADEIVGIIRPEEKKSSELRIVVESVQYRPTLQLVYF